MTPTTGLTADSFTTDQYRTFISCVEYNDCDGNGRKLLLQTIYAHLKEHPDDPKYAYLKKKFYSPEFMEKIYPTGKIPEHIQRDKVFIENPTLLSR